MNDEFNLNQHHEVLDHGFVKGIESWGSDERIIESARMSTGKGFQGWKDDCSKCGSSRAWIESGKLEEGEDFGSDCDHAFLEKGDEKLLRYLWENKHHTPFEMAGLTIEVQAPIFVFREWHRHRVPFSYNEMSARYTPLPDLNYVPTVERLMLNANGSNKQAGTIADAMPLTEVGAKYFQRKLTARYSELEADYQMALKDGVPKELARVLLPVGRYSRMRASANLRGWCNFLSLRQAPNAQYEIRVYADAVNKILTSCFPRTMNLFTEGLSK